jgi:hypothetical protein
MSADSWQTFADAIGDENRFLGELGSAALALTDALVCGTPADIEATERKVEAMRVLHGHAHGRRQTMQKRGFGDLSLQQVCAYAPGPLRRKVYMTLHELTTRAIALQITVNNNKALIMAGMNRLTRTVEVLQRSMTEQTGTYKRRGTVPISGGSVIMSRRA